MSSVLLQVGVLSRKDLLHMNVEQRMEQQQKEAMSRKRTVTQELIEKSRSNSITLNPVTSPLATSTGSQRVGEGGGTPASFSPVLPPSSFPK
jgi:hypothetical protein